MTLYEQIERMLPGDSIKISLPENFEVEYEDCRGNKCKATLARLNAYYWDDSDHRIKDIYLYDINGEQFAKGFDLTDESQAKVDQYLKSA